MPRSYIPTYGDNIFELGGVVSGTLRAAGWDRTKIDSALDEITKALCYDDAVNVCRRYITIRNAE